MRSNDERWELLGRVMVKWLSFGPNPSTETTAVSGGRQTPSTTRRPGFWARDFGRLELAVAGTV
jgi:hypothetical protein